MPRTPKRKNLRPPGKCILCGEEGVTETHVFPKWLGELLPFFNARREIYEYRTAPSALEQKIISHKNEVKQGHLFRIRPKLLCRSCNNYFGRIEDAMVTFARPLFITDDPVIATRHQMRVLSVWISLIVILSEYYYDYPDNIVTINISTLEYIKKYMYPPPEWSIFCSTISARRWTQYYRRHFLFMYDGTIVDSPIRTETPNTQITSLGMGRLFAQIYTSTIENTVIGYRHGALASGLTPLWPHPNILGLFPKRSTKFPTKTVLNDESADIAADSFYIRLHSRMNSHSERGTSPF